MCQLFNLFYTSVLKASLDCFSRNIQTIDACEINVVDDYLCEGYGSYNRQIEKTIYNQFTSNGMPLDPTYTGKAFWGMQDYLEKNNITQTSHTNKVC